MRDLVEVIEKIQSKVPDSEEKLRTELKDTHSSVMMASPEMMPFWWRETAGVLQGNIPLPKKDWELKVVDIWFNQEKGD